MSNFLTRHGFGAQKFKTALMAGAAVMAMTTAAMAQEVKTADDEVILLEPISMEAKADVITGGVQLEQEDLNRINPETVRDVFRQEPGVGVSSPLGISQQIHVNGIEDTNLHVDIDGARQANKTYHHIGTTVMDPGMLKAAKVETGVAPADAGPNALGGTISMETKDGRDFVGPDEMFGGFVKASFDSNTRGFSKDLAFATRYEGFDAMLYGTQSTGNDYEDARGNELDGSRPAMENFLLKTGYTADNGYRLKFTANRFEDSAARPARADFVAAAVSFATPIQYTRQNYALSFGDETPTDMWDPKITIAHTNTDLDLMTGHLVFGQQNWHMRSAIKTVNGKASNTFTTNHGKYTVGTDFFADTGKGGFRGFIGTEKANDIGVFGQARLTLTDTLRTSFGARFDRSELTGMDLSKHNDSGFSGNANLEFDATEEVMLYGGASTVFGGFQIAEVGLFGGNGGNTIANYDDLETSRSFNYKAGAVIEVGDFTIDGNGYITRINDANDLGATTTRGNQNTLHSRGFNLSGKYSYDDGFAKLGLSTNTLRVNGVYQLATASDYLGVDAGESITFEMAHTLRDYDLTLGTTNEAVLPDDTQKGVLGEGLEGYIVSNIYTEWMPSQADGLSLRFDVNNLFNQQYTNRMNVGLQSNSTTVAAFQEPGRSFVLTAKYDF